MIWRDRMIFTRQQGFYPARRPWPQPSGSGRDSGRIPGNGSGDTRVPRTGATEEEGATYTVMSGASADPSPGRTSTASRQAASTRALRTNRPRQGQTCPEPRWALMSLGDEGASFAVNDDIQLINRASSGDHLAYGELVRRYTLIAHRTATLVVGSADAEDVVQEAFVRAFYALDRFRQGSQFKPWLLAIVTNCARNKRRAYGQQSRLRERLTGASNGSSVAAAHVVASAESAVLDAQDRHDLAHAIDELPENARLVVTCRYLLELSEAETAQVLGWPVGTVKSRLSRALDRLRIALAETGPGNRKHP